MGKSSLFAFSALVLFFSILIWYSVQYLSKPLIPTWSPQWSSPVVLDDATLSQFNGKLGNKAYLVILGEVYDVSSGDHYKEGSGYSVFIAQDRTAAFSTGDFDDSSKLDDLLKLSHTQLLGIAEWVDFYRNHETYTFVGVLIGKYYTAAGKRTSAWKAVRKLMLQEPAAAPIETLTKCSIKWESTVTTYWCEDQTKLVPRKRTGEKSCVCVTSAKAKQPDLEAFPGCGETASLCVVSV